MRVRPLLAFSLALSLAAQAAFGAKPPALAPAFHLPAQHGLVTLDSLRGKVVLVDFWASWCAPCARSFPWMNALHDSLSRQGLEIVAINLDKERADAEAFLAQHAPRFDVAFDPQGEVAEAYHVMAMPTSFVIGRTGELVLMHPGFDPKKAGDLEAVIRKECEK
ncbi:MAG: TlpA disulfide reductase family protein [Candidatus Eiseniibacteriota bacterium]